MALPSVAAIGQPRAWGYDGSLNDLLIRLAAAPTTPLSVVGSSPEAPRVSTSTLPEEFVSEFGLTFGRSDLSGGAGLDLAHRRNPEDSDPVRYWDSENVNVPARGPGELPYVELLPDPKYHFDSVHVGGQWVGLPTTRMVVLDNGSVLRSTSHAATYPCATGSELVRIDDPTGTPTFAYEQVSASLVYRCETWKNFAKLGSRIYLGMDAGQTTDRGLWWRPTTQTGTWTQLGVAAVSDVWSVKGRLIGTLHQAGTLFEIDPSDGSTTLLLTVPVPETTSVQAVNTHQVFNSVHDVGPYVMATSWNGYVYAFEDVSGTLTLVGQTAMSPGESPLYLAYHPSGIVMMSTYEFIDDGIYDRQCNLYTARVDSTNGQLIDVQLLHIFKNEPLSINETYGAWMGPFTIWRDEVLFQSKGLFRPNDPVAGSYNMEWQMWKYNVATGGLFPTDHIGWGASALGPGEVLVIKNQRVTTWGAGFHELDDGENTDTNHGFIMYPAVDFYTGSEKTWLDLTVDVENTGWTDPASAYVQGYYSTDMDALHNEDHPSWTLIGTWQNNPPSSSQVESGEALPLSVSSRFLLIKLSPTSNDPSVYRPRVLGVTLRAFVHSDEFVIDLPINVSDRVEAPGRQAFISPGWGRAVTTELLSMRGSKADLELFDPPLTATGIVEAIRVDVPHLPKAGTVTDVATVRFRGKLT